MRSLKEILKRDDEREDLRNYFLCILLVFVLVVSVFALASIDFSPEGMTDESKNVELVPRSP